MNERKISDSQINSWCRCPMAWKFRYIDKIKIAPSWAITGRSAHAAEEANYEQKLVSYKDLPMNDVRDIAAGVFDDTLKSSDEEVFWDEGETPDKAKDRTVTGVEAYHQYVAPQVQPIMVEQAINVELPWGTMLTGRIDVVDQDTAIRDTKHISYKPRPGEDWYGTQPGLYGWAYQQLTGDQPKFKYDYVVLGRKDAKKPKPDTHTVETTINPKRIQIALNRAEAVDKAIQSGNVYAVPSPFNCGGCGYRKLCPYSMANR